MRAKAYEHIQRKIAMGELRTGSAVSELSLAQELGSSRTPIREAIGQLIAEGFLEQRPNSSAVVVELTRNDVIHLYEMREALEVYSVGKAARSPMRAADLQRLHEMTDELLRLRDELVGSGKKALDPPQWQRFLAADFGFHMLLMCMAANPRIIKVVNETRLLIRIFALRHSGREAPALEKVHAYHSQILEAVSEHEAEKAMRVVSEHIQASLQESLNEYDHAEREASLRANFRAFFDGDLSLTSIASAKSL